MDHQEFAQLLGNYGEFVGAFAVVATLVYLAVQIRRDRQATTANTRQLRAASARELYLAAATSDKLAPIFDKLNSGDQIAGPMVELKRQFGLENEEAIRAHFWYLANLRQAEANLRMPMTDHERTQNSLQLAAGMSGPLGVWWDQAKAMFAPDFVEEMDRIRESAVTGHT